MAARAPDGWRIARNRIVRRMPRLQGAENHRSVLRQGARQWRLRQHQWRRDCRRIENVAKRAAYTQPERRIVSLGWEGKTLEVLTTSQKLAHRIARELKKAFGGRTTYAWSDRDGTLSATWRKEGARASRRIFTSFAPGGQVWGPFSPPARKENQMER